MFILITSAELWIYRWPGNSYCSRIWLAGLQLWRKSGSVCGFGFHVWVKDSGSAEADYSLKWPHELILIKCKWYLGILINMCCQNVYDALKKLKGFLLLVQKAVGFLFQMGHDTPNVFACTVLQGGGGWIYGGVLYQSLYWTEHHGVLILASTLLRIRWGA